MIVTMTIQRQSPRDETLILENGKEVTHVKSQFFKDRGFASYIRIQKDDYVFFPTEGFLGHFNLEYADHSVGKIYALPKIIRPGSFDPETGTEKLPLLSFDDIYYGECIKIEQKIPYEKLNETYFEHSFTNIKSVDVLKKNILKRYQKSMPNLKEEDILARGVAFTLLRLERSIEKLLGKSELR
jgi:hypothetical protein